MNEEIMKALGMEQAVKDFDSGICPTCKKKIDIQEFRDVLSRKEYGISGMCQECQDKTFGK